MINLERGVPRNSRVNQAMQMASTIANTLPRFSVLESQTKDLYIREGKGRRLFGGTELIQFVAALAILHHAGRFEEMDEQKSGHLASGCFGKMDNLPVHSTPNHHPTKMDVLQKTVLPIILAAKFRVRHSSTTPKQQRQPLPSLLCKSFFFGWNAGRGSGSCRKCCQSCRKLRTRVFVYMFITRKSGENRREIEGAQSAK